MKLLIDTSSHNTISQEQWDLLATVLDGVIIRLSFGVTEDVKATEHVANARKRNLPFIGYHWVDPTWDFIRQVDKIGEVNNKHKPAGTMLDHEQYWTDWAAYMRQDLVAAYATRFTSKQINDFSLKIYKWSVDNLNLPIANYSADWFINRYCPELAWVKSKNYVEARYFRYYDAVWWNAKKAELGIPFDISHMKEIAEYAGVPNGIGRQFESYIEVKGLAGSIGYHLDWLTFTDAGFNEMFNLIQLPDEGEIPMPETNAQTTVNLNVRPTPSTTGTVLKTLPTGTRINTTGTVLAGIWWSRIDYPLVGYVSNQYVLHDPVVTPPPVPPINNVEDVIDALEKVKVYIDSLIAELGQ